MNRPASPLFVANPARFSTAEFLRMGEGGAFAGMRVELVDGELHRMNPPLTAHSILQSELHFSIRTALGTGAGYATLVEVGIDLGGDTVRGCDIAIVKALPSESRLLRPDEVMLVIEIAESSMARDMGAKKLDYARAGVAHYWVVDGERKVVHIHAEPVAGDYVEVRSVRFGAPLAIPGTDAAITLD